MAADAIHLTLAFLGDVEAGAQPPLLSALAAIEAPPFRLELDRLGSFARGIVWVGADRTPAPLLALQAEVNACVGALGVRVERRPFAAHLTLVRHARDVVRREIPALEWVVGAFRLVASELDSAGARYRPVAEWSLRAGGPLG